MTVSMGILLGNHVGKLEKYDFEITMEIGVGI